MSQGGLKRPRWRVLIAIVVGTPVLAFGAWTALEWWDHRSRHVELPPPPPTHPPRLVLEPASVDLGRISQCDGLVRIKGTIRNDSDQPTLLDDWIPSCGCTGPRGLVRGTTIAPGESLDFELLSDSWATPGEKRYTLDFRERHADGLVRFEIRYIVESPLHTDSNFLTRIIDEVSPLVVKSRDNRPFRILSLEPPLAEIDSSEVASAHTLRLVWRRVDLELGDGWTEQELKIHTDREDCPTLSVRLESGLPDGVAEIIPYQPVPVPQ
ncbi:MAG: DUF1573 domain-containing protein [Phycisphaeraceae bacterium]|nr:DUF1573 domain-containing protein [Phycisphaeraceae bacterium]